MTEVLQNKKEIKNLSEKLSVLTRYQPNAEQQNQAELSGKWSFLKF